MTHEYTLLIRGTILAGTGQPPASAIAWAGGVVLALGTDAQVLGVSRGDSHVIELHGAFVVPIAEDASPTWPPSGTLEIGGPADFALLGGDPRVPGDHPPRLVGVVRAATSWAVRSPRRLDDRHDPLDGPGALAKVVAMERDWKIQVG